jgi:hypothetical protein
MVRVTIVSLIYKSPRMADWIYESVMGATPMIRRGEARFLFVANDPTPECLQHLESRGYDHIVSRSPARSVAELFAEGYAAPEYMHRVYRGYNEGIEHASSPTVVLINSDNYLCVDWLENLEKYATHESIITSTLVEPGHPRHGVFPDAIEADFGRTLDTFDAEGFLGFAERLKETGLVAGGAYMPCLFYREAALAAGLYPEGNLAGTSFEDVREYGDVAFFERLRRTGVRHYTSLDSVVYHLKEGEKDDGGAALHTQKGSTARAPSHPGRVARRAQVVVRRQGEDSHLGADWIGYLHSEVNRALRQLPRGVSRFLKPVLPSWGFRMLREAWLLVKRVVR